MNIYLDIDGTILQADGPYSARLADDAVELLTYIVEKCNVYWLTTHCKGDAQTAVSYLSEYCPPELLPVIRKIKPTEWRTLKTEAIDLAEPFLWLDDYPLHSELAFLDSHSRAGCQVLVSLKHNGELERVLNRVKKLVEGEPGPLADIPRQKIVFFTGAGISKESGIATFRDDDGLWQRYDPEILASASGFFENTEASLAFYNERRANLAKCHPNRAHQIIAELEKNHDVTVVTQNVDDLHERAGNTRVIHLHGELRKVTSSRQRLAPECIQEYPLDKPIKVGDFAADGSQMRPAVVMFGEFLSDKDSCAAESAIRGADIFVVIGTSLKVYPAAAFVHYADKYALKYIIDPNHDGVEGFTLISEPATIGVERLIDMLQSTLSED